VKFSFKVFICTIVIVAVSFSIGTYLLLSGNLNSAMDREIKRGLEEYQLLRFAYESAAISSELQGEELTEETMRDLATQVAGSIDSQERFAGVYGSSFNEIYSNYPFPREDRSLLQSLPQGQRKYTIENIDGRLLLTVVGSLNLDSALVYLYSSRDITEVFQERDRQVKSFVLLDILIMAVSAAVMLIISILLTLPIDMLKKASAQIAAGDFSRRAAIWSKDEIGELAVSFNKMADAVEEKVAELERNARQKEEFVANFTHELKTPLTSIIGYADMLRSKECDRETIFRAASYIFSEGKRLESLSFKLLELLYLENQTVTLKEINTIVCAEEIEKSMKPLLADSNLKLDVSMEDCIVLAEPDLIKTLLINLIDNARKASMPGQSIELTGKKKGKDSYLICVRDHGRGISKEELPKITHAFYMVDKSRARKQHGAGLGLALSSRIAVLHGTELVFESELGQGTQVYFSLKRVSKSKDKE